MRTILAASGGMDSGFMILLGMAAGIGAYLYVLAKKPRPADEKLERYRVLTAQLLEGIPDDELVGAVCANILAKLNRTDPFHSISLMSAGRSGVYALWLLDREMEAGGFSAFSKGPSAVFGETAVQALVMLGLDNHARLLRGALEAETGNDEDAAVGAWGKAWREHNPTEDCIVYIRSNPEQFTDA